MKLLTIYLDTNILSRITDLKISEQTAKAYEALSQRTDIQLVTSEKTSQEIKITPNQSRASMLQFIYSLFHKVPMKTMRDSGCVSGAPIGCTPLSGDWTDPLLNKLETIFDSDDSEHIFQSIKSDCSFFLTLDKKSILNRVSSNPDLLFELCPNLKFVSPEEMINFLENQKST